MWKVVFIARSKNIAERIQEQLQVEGVLSKIRPLGNETNTSQYELLVPESEVEEAQEVLNTLV